MYGSEATRKVANNGATAQRKYAVTIVIILARYKSSRYYIDTHENITLISMKYNLIGT